MFVCPGDAVDVAVSVFVLNGRLHLGDDAVRFSTCSFSAPRLFVEGVDDEVLGLDEVADLEGAAQTFSYEAVARDVVEDMVAGSLTSVDFFGGDHFEEVNRGGDLLVHVGCPETCAHLAGVGAVDEIPEENHGVDVSHSLEHVYPAVVPEPALIG